MKKRAAHKWPLTRQIHEVEWDDSSGMSGWGTVESYTKERDSKCMSIGYLLREDKTIVTLMQSMDRATGKVDSSITIPKRVITKRRRIS